MFNEIHYHSAGDESQLEWVELYNHMAVDMDVSRWRIGGGISFDFAEGTIVPGRSHIVVAADPAALKQQTGVSALGPFSGRLSNGGEELLLLNNNDRLMNSVDYQDSGAWPVGPDGSGFTLAKREETLPSHESESWTVSVQRGGTPGAANSTPGAPTLQINEVAPASSAEFFVEITNSDTDSQTLAEHVLASSEGRQLVLPDQVLAPGEHTVISADQLGFIPRDGELLFLYGPARSRLLDARQVMGRLRGRSPEHDDRWLYPSAPTPGQDNAFSFHDEIVINEIMYHPFGELSNIPAVDVLRSTQTSSAVVEPNSTGTALVPTDDCLGDSWHQLDFDDTAWHTVTPAVGFDTGGVSDVVAYGYLAGAGGTSLTGFSLGQDFTVNSAIKVTQLGVFDSDADGLSRTLTAELWSRNGDAGLLLATMSFTPGDPGTLVGSSRFKPLAQPLFLQLGDYTIVARGYGAEEPVGHEGFGGPGPEFKTLDDGGGAISFVGTGRSGLRAGVFPNNPAAGTANYYSAGTFQFDAVSPVSPLVTTDLEADMHQVNSSAYFRFAFTAPDFDQLDTVNMFLRMKYDDGFVAYVNGVEVARRNAPAIPRWNSAATAVDAVSSRFERFDITADVANLVSGTNVLAIQGLNASAVDNDFLILPELRISVTSGIEPQEDWLELYNRSGQSVDLTDWKLTGGIDFDFPAGTAVAPDSYLVVAKNADQLASRFPGIDVLGNFSRRLSNRGELIQLIDDQQNPADEVHYYQDGYWPTLADGGGSSLELRSPEADNSQPGAWEASAEAGKSSWNLYSYRGIANPFESDGPQYHELVIGLLDAGEILLDDITVVEDPSVSARQLIQNSTFDMDVIGDEASSWRIYGNQFGTVVKDPDNPNNQVLHLRATGTTEDMHNLGETTLSNGGTNVHIVPGREYEISFRAKWLGGINLFNTRLYYNSVAHTAALPVPELKGTPGAKNSRYEPNIGPTYQGFMHGPIVPAAGQSVTVTAVADDPHGVSAATLYWRVVSGDGGAWQYEPMIVAVDGHLRGTIPGHGGGTVVQFYVETTDGLGVTSMFPRSGSESHALFKVQDGQARTGARHNLRIIQATADVNFQLDQINRMSNHRFGGTVIFNESEVFYDVGVRLKGASSSRPSGDHGYNIRFHTAKRFLSVHNTITIDRNNLAEMLIKHLNNHADDVPSMYNDAVYLIAPYSSATGVAMLRMAGFNDVYLDSQFKGGGQGMLIDKEIIYRPNGTIFGRKHPAYHHTDQGNADTGIDFWGTDKEAYRLQWRIKNHHDRDDLSRVVDLNAAFRLGDDPTVSKDQWNAALEEVIDLDQWLRVLAMLRLAGVADFYSQSPGNHNYLVLVRPEDNKLVMLPGDMDLAFSKNVPLVGTEHHPRIREIVKIPVNLRTLYGHLESLIATSYNASYSQTWVSHFSRMFPGVDFTEPARYIGNRANSVLNQLPAQVPFSIKTSDPMDVGTDTTAMIEGNGWINVRQLRLAGSARPLDVNFKTDQETDWADGWEVTLPLSHGTKKYVLEAYDFQGELIGTDTITVDRTVDNDVIGSLRITELNYHPSEPTEAESAAIPGVNQNDFEFVEFQNISTQPINLLGVHFMDDDGLYYTFPDTVLLAGARGVIVKDMDAFQLRFGTGLNPIGPFAGGSLGNGGDHVTLIDSLGTMIHDFVYDDTDPWPERTDGAGSSLQVIETEGDYNDPHNWWASIDVGGSPGAEGMPRSAGDANDDGQFDSSDMMLVLAAGKFETGQTARWEEGDWDGDGLFTFDDVLAALATGTFETGAAVVSRNLAMVGVTHL